MVQTDLTFTVGDPTDWTTTTVWPQPYRTDQTLNWYSLTASVTVTAQEPVMKITAKKHLVISRATGCVAEVHDSKDEALAAAKRLAAKEQDEFYVFAPTATVRPKPVDVEVVEA